MISPRWVMAVPGRHVTTAVTAGDPFIYGGIMNTFWDSRQHEQAEAVAKPAAKPLTGRPDRLTIINADDIINLKIALGTYESLEEFLEVV